MLPAASLAFSAFLAATPVAVDVEALEVAGMDTAALDDLYGHLVVRLLESGYSVGAEADATLRLQIDRLGDHYEVTVLGDGVRHSRSTRPATPEVERLELQHRALEVLRLVAEDGDAEELDTVDALHMRDVAVEFDERVEVATAADLYGTIVVGLLRGDLRVVPMGSTAAWRVCVRVEEDGEISVGRVDGAFDCSHSATVRTDLEGLETHVAAMRGGSGLESGRAAGGVGEASLAANGVERGVVTRTASSPRPPSLRLEAGVGALLRSGGTDGWVRVGARGLARAGFGGAVLVALAPSRAGAARFFSTYLEAGPVWGRRLGSRGELSVGLLGGILLHRWRGLPATVTGEAGSWSPSAEVAMDYGWRVARSVVVALGVAPGMSLDGQDHTDDNQEVIWQRGALRLGFSLSAHYVWGET
ncbi:MAG: hypothetical protein V3V08_19730 [Nannocystaceae bacterium]